MQKGNVLFLILLAVALFAALSYAVTQSSRSGGSNASRETIRMQAAEYTQYLTSIRQAVDRVRLINSCRDTQLSFEYDSDSDGVWNDSDDDYYNINAPTDLRCHLFHPEGGGISYRDPLSYPFAEYSVGGPFLQRFSSTSAIEYIGSEAAELYVYFRFLEFNEYADMFCEEFNSLNGNGKIADITLAGTTINAGIFDGTFSASPHNAGVTYSSGEMAACHRHSGGTSYVGWFVLLER